MEREISRVFSTLCLFLQSKKKSTFFPFLLFNLVFLADSCQIKAGISFFGPLDWQLSKMTGNCEQRIVTLIIVYNSVVAHFFSGNVSRCRTFTSRLRWTRREKRVKLKSSTLNNGTLAMIFRLVLNREIYIHFLQRRGDNSLTLAFTTSRTLRRCT